MSKRGQDATLAADPDPYPWISAAGGQASVRVTDAYTLGATSRSQSKGRPVRSLPGGPGTATPPSVSDSQSGATSFHDLGGQAEAMERLDAQLLGIEAELLAKLAAIKQQREAMAAELDRMDSEAGSRRNIAEPSPLSQPGKFSLLGLFRRKTKKESQSTPMARPVELLPAHQPAESEAGAARAAPLAYPKPPSVSDVARPVIAVIGSPPIAPVQYQREPRGSSEKRSSILQARRSNAHSLASVQGRQSSGLISRLASSNRQSTGGDSSIYGGGSIHGGRKTNQHHSRSQHAWTDSQSAMPVDQIAIGGNLRSPRTILGRKSDHSQPKQESIVSLPKGGSYFTEGPTLNAFIKHLTHARAGDDSAAPNVPGALTPPDRRSRTSDVGRILGLDTSTTGQRSANPSRIHALSRMSTATPRTSGGLSSRTSRTYGTSKAGTVTTRSHSRVETDSETGSVARIRTTPGLSDLPGGALRVSCPVIPESSAGLKVASPHWAAKEMAFDAAPGAAQGLGLGLAAVAAARDTRSIDAVKRSNVLEAQRQSEATRFPIEDAPAPIPEPRKRSDAGCFGSLFGCFRKSPPPQIPSRINRVPRKQNPPAAAALASAAQPLAPSVAAEGPRGSAPAARKTDPWAQLNEALRSEATAAESRRGSITAAGGSRTNSKMVTFV